MSYFFNYQMSGHYSDISHLQLQIMKNKQQGLLFYFKGDSDFLNLVNLKVQTNINLNKPHYLSLPLKPIEIDKIDFVQPIIQIQTFNELSRQNYLKNKNNIKEGIIYVYFPVAIRVDEKIYKIYSTNYQNLVKQFPKSVRNNFAKLIIWQQGQGQHSLQNQKVKLNQIISQSMKIIVEKKIEALNLQINLLQNQQSTEKNLKNLFILRNKISSIYKQLKLQVNSSQHFSLLFKDILYNHFRLTTGQKTGNNTIEQKISYKSPFMIKNINKVVSYFDTKQNYLQIVSFCFIKLFQVLLDLLQQLEAMKQLKTFLDYILANIFANVSNKQEDISKNLWIVEIIDECLKVINNKALPAIFNPTKQVQFSILNVSICGIYRSSIQKIGISLYGINTYVVFPRNLKYQLGLCIKSLIRQKIDESDYPQLKIVNKHQQVNKLNILSGDPVTQTVECILNNFNTFKIVYVKTLQLMESTLNSSPYKKVGWSMKLSVLKAALIYFSSQDQKKLQLNKIIQDDKIFSFDAKKAVWQDLSVINKIYRLAICRRYNIRMSIQDLLNVIFNKSIINFEQEWSKLTKIVSMMLFEYKSQQSEFDYIDYGQQQQGRTRRRKTTIHYQNKQIQVGTMKYISIIQEIREGQKYNKRQKNCKVKLNIELSNRILASVMPLIIKNNSQSHQGKDELIEVKLKVTKSIQNEEKFQYLKAKNIIAQDKIIEVQIQQNHTLIFKIVELIIIINKDIKLTFTMPLNPQKMNQFLQDNTEHYKNISPQIKLNTIQIVQTKIEKSNQIQSVNRKQSFNSFNSKTGSKSSYSGVTQNIYYHVWTPIQFELFTCFESDFLIEKVVIQCPDVVNQTIFINEEKIDWKKSQQNLKCHGFKHHILLIVKSESKQGKFKDYQYVQNVRNYKNSQSILPKSISMRSRNSSMSRSFASVVSSGTLNIGSQNVNILTLKILVNHEGYKYTLQKSMKYRRKMPFKIDYRYCGQLQQYRLTNFSKQTFLIKTMEQNQQEEQNILYPKQELSLFSNVISVSQQVQDINIDNKDKNIFSEQIQSFTSPLNLKSYIKPQLIKPQKISTIWLKIQEKDKYKYLHPIKIMSQECGYVSLLKVDQSYQIIGKIDGLAQYINLQNRQIQLYIVPTEKGVIYLPQISINSKKGVWNTKKILVD